jgi:hypothetical protein
MGKRGAFFFCRPISIIFLKEGASMNLVFMNSLDKPTEEGRVVTAQVSICESQGQWQVLWNEPDDDGRMNRTVWYEGTSWDEMLSEFRYQLAIKLGEGFVPLLEPMMGSPLPTGKQRFTRMLQYYSEQHADEAVFEQLRQWRRTRAQAEGKSAFFIATNRELRMISAFLPQTEEELMQIPGFGRGKAALYGADILEHTRTVTRETSFPLHWVENAIDARDFEKWLHRLREESFKKEKDKVLERRRLLEAVQTGRSLSDLQEMFAVPRRELLLQIEELAQSGYDMEPIIESETRSLPRDEYEQIWRGFEQLGEKYLKPVLELVYGEGNLQGEKLEQAYERLRLIRIRYRNRMQESQPAAAV